MSWYSWLATFSETLTSQIRKMVRKKLTTQGDNAQPSTYSIGTLNFGKKLSKKPNLISLSFLSLFLFILSLYIYLYNLCFPSLAPFTCNLQEQYLSIYFLLQHPFLSRKYFRP